MSGTWDRGGKSDAAPVVDDDELWIGSAMGGRLEATLHGKSEYLPLFRDHRTAGHWFPKSMYITRFMESGFRTLADYEEDIDVTTGAPGVTIESDSLGMWKENVIPFRGQGGDDQKNNAVWIGWNNRIAGPDTTKMGRPASYTLTLADSLVNAWRVSDKGALYSKRAMGEDVVAVMEEPTRNAFTVSLLYVDVPSTVSRATGLVVPMPTSPPPLTRIRSVPAVLMAT